eukprot:scaffold961_cov122-Cylindrotheca_fusiformis.AAC.18
MAPRTSLSFLLDMQHHYSDDEDHFCISDSIKLCQSPLIKTVSTERHVEFADPVAMVESSDAPNYIPDSDCAHSWWTADEYKQMSLNNRATLEKMTSSNLHAPEETDFCLLGLEGCGKVENEKRRKQRQHATKAVLSAQDLQRKQGLNDPVYIAELSKTCTKNSRRRAFLQAFQDKEIPEALLSKFHQSELNSTHYDLVDVSM